MPRRPTNNAIRKRTRNTTKSSRAHASLLVAAQCSGSCVLQWLHAGPVEHTVRKVTPDDVRRDTGKAMATAAQAATQAKEDFEMRLTSSLADMDAEIAKEKGAQSAWDDVRQAFQAAAEEF